MSNKEVTLKEFLKSEFPLTFQSSASYDELVDILWCRWNQFSTLGGDDHERKMVYSDAVTNFSPVVVGQLQLSALEAKEEAQMIQTQMGMLQAELDGKIDFYTAIDRLFEWKVRIVPTAEKYQSVQS